MRSRGRSLLGNLADVRLRPSSQSPGLRAMADCHAAPSRQTSGSKLEDAGFEEPARSIAISSRNGSKGDDCEVLEALAGRLPEPAMNCTSTE